MSLPLPRDMAPMEARPVEEIPVGDIWQYEPKWDGFRCIAFRDGAKMTLMSKAGKPLTRYFPEIVAALLSLKVQRFILDGEIVVPDGKRLAFDQLLQRIHPAASRITRMSTEWPALYIVFDLLADGQDKTMDQHPLEQRRAALEKFVKPLAGVERIALSPATGDLRTVQRWFRTTDRGLDGVMAKRLDLAYQSGTRDGMQKIKHAWTADCVVGGFRYATNSTLVGSLLLGLFNDAGELDHVGFTSGLAKDERPALTKKLEALVRPPGFTGKAPGGPSRWSTARTGEWEPLAWKLVVEVEYDHFTGGRFRHGTRLVRWRPDKAPKQCTLEQLLRSGKSALALLQVRKTRASAR